MKIAIITETFLPSTDGIVTRLTAAIRWLRKQGHEVLVIAPDLGVSNFEGARIDGIKARRFFLYKDKELALPTMQVGRSLHQFDPDVVHVVNPAVLGVAGIFYGRKWPLVASYHTNIPQYADFYKLPFLKPILWQYLKLLHNRADLNLCTSNTVLQELNGRRFKNVKLWDRGVDLERFGKDKWDDQMRHRLTEGEIDKTLLLYVGRLAAEKEIEKLRPVLEASDHIRLAIVGDGPHRAVLEQHFSGTRTVFTGFLHGEDLSKAYASSDIFAFPSTTETLGLVLLEAMASGLPVVAANSGPTREQMTHGLTGFLYDPANGNSLTEHILTLQNEHLRAKMGEYCRELAYKYGWDGPSKQLYQFYQSVLKTKEVKLETTQEIG